MDNSEKQRLAIEAIKKISQDADMFVFMLVDEDLETFIDENGNFTQDEKDEIWERMNDAFLDRFHEMLSMVVSNVKQERNS